MEFIQRPGDIVLLPNDYVHCTFNLRPSIGVASQLNFDLATFADLVTLDVNTFTEESWQPFVEMANNDSVILDEDGVFRPFTVN